MRAVIYARISRDEAGDALGVQRQVEDCLALCERRGWRVVATLVDNDVSAYSGRRRPQYDQLLSTLAGGGADRIVAWAPERLHRSPRELEDFLELLDRTGTSVETVKAGAWDVSTSHGRLVARMLGAVSRAESERTGERVSRAHQQAKGQGLWRGAIPYGMRRSGRPGIPEPDPERAAVVQDILTRARRGDALTQIAHDLNLEGIKPRRGQAWTHTGISRLINSPALGGLVDVEGELQTAEFEGIVSAEEWRETRAALRRRPRGEVSRPRQRLSLLGGLLTCHEHGCPCFAAGQVGVTRLYSAAVAGRCFVSISRTAADHIVTNIVLERLRRPDAAQLFSQRSDNRDLDRQIVELRQRREEIADLLTDGLLSGADARPRLRGISERLAELETSRSPTQILAAELADPEGAWLGWTVTQRREVLRVLFSSLSVKHVGNKNGPTTQPSRLILGWADDDGAGSLITA